MAPIPETLKQAIRPITVVVGHYGVGKTNFTVNLALDLASVGKDVTVIDLDIVNPYFRASEKRTLFEDNGIELIAPVFAEAGSSLDVPSLTGKITPALSRANDSHVVLIDVGGDDAGATALGRYSQQIAEGDYAMLYVLNCFRNLVRDLDEAVQNLREVEQAARMQVTALVNNSHLKSLTTVQTIEEGIEYANAVSELVHLPLVCTTALPKACSEDVENEYPIEAHVRTPWE